MEPEFDGRDCGGRGSAKPELARLLEAAIDDGCRSLFVYHYDRVSRDPSELNEIVQELQQLGVDVQIVDSAGPEDSEGG